MAEVAKILSPSKKVILPDINAGCSLEDSCKVDDFRKFKQRYPNHIVVTYINCSAEIKAESEDYSNFMEIPRRLLTVFKR